MTKVTHNAHPKLIQKGSAKNWGGHVSKPVLMSSSGGPDFSAFLRIMSSRFLLLIPVEEVSNI